MPAQCIISCVTATDLHRRAPRPLIEEVQAPVAASQAVTPPHAEGNTLEAAAVQPSQHAVGSLAGSEPGTSKPSSTGLKGGFFNRNAKPKKGILKNTEPPPPISEVTDANGETHTNLAPQRPSCPTVARQLVQQDDQSDTRQAAFSGFVRERDQPVQVRLAAEVGCSLYSAGLLRFRFVVAFISVAVLRDGRAKPNEQWLYAQAIVCLLQAMQ